MDAEILDAGGPAYRDLLSPVSCLLTPNSQILTPAATAAITPPHTPPITQPSGTPDGRLIPDGYRDAAKPRSAWPQALKPPAIIDK